MQKLVLKNDSKVIRIGGSSTEFKVIDRDEMQVVCEGRESFGGRDFDSNVADYFLSEFQKMHSIDLSAEKETVENLKNSIRSSKPILDISVETWLQVANFYQGKGFATHLARVKFEEVNMNLFKRIFEMIDSSLKECKLEREAIKDFLMIGGSSNTPKIKVMAREFFGKDPIKLYKPEEAVVLSWTRQLLCHPDQRDDSEAERTSLKEEL
eukprot:TRINITY_DN195_c0_g2_i1.p2 TRINITY_DN195_c0_g2~~TRINITY_DN195_c0_g2_i1.p2  ORF type:complete len:210 (-),score=82.48 TRINITY_DN195_c0_g2_i1:117-746(-)